MRTHTQGFKEQIKELGREIDSKITYGDNTITSEDLYSISPILNGELLKSVMKELDFESSIKIPQYTVIKYEFGLKVDGEYEYLNYGNYIVYSSEYNEDTRTYEHICYDSMLFAMKEYTTLQNGTFPMTVREYLTNLCLDCNLVFKNANDTFANYDKTIESDLYANLGYTYRDIFDELSQVTASSICIDSNNMVEVRYINETNDTIDEEFLKDINVKFGEKYGPINSIVLSRSGESDNVFLRDEESVSSNGICELKIIDNQIMNFNDRSDYLTDILAKLNGLEYFLNDYSSTGILYYEMLDKYNVKIGDNTYPCILFNDEPKITQGLVEDIYTESLEESVTDYTKADKTDRRINQAYIIVDKQNQKIEAVVEKTNTIQKQIIPTAIATGSDIYVEDASNNPLIDLEIEGKSIQETRSGKNKLGILPFNNLLSNGVTTSFDGKTFTITGTNTQNWYRLSEHYDVDISVGRYLLSYVESTQSRIVLSLTFDDETRQDFWLISNKMVIDITKPVKSISLYTDGQTVNSIINKTITGLMLEPMESGSTPTEWEQYGVSPSPDFPSEIESVGTYNQETGKYEIEVKINNETDTNTLLIILNEPPRSLPNGVKDIAYIKNGKLYVDRKIGSIILNGSENWNNQFGINLFNTPQLHAIGRNAIPLNSHYVFNNVQFGIDATLSHGQFAVQDNGNGLFLKNTDISTVEDFKTWLSTHNTQIDYELLEPYTEELGEIQMPSTFKGINNISTTDDLLPIINLTYVRDTIIADYVENHVAELKITENEIKESVESVSSSVDGLNTTINRVEEITTDNSQVINIISTNIDQTTGEVREVTTTTGFTFNADGMTIDDGSGFKAQHRAGGTYYKDGDSIVGQYTKDGSKQKDLQLFGIYSYGMRDKDDTPMFIAQLYNDENGEECFGHFYNGGGY